MPQAFGQSAVFGFFLLFLGNTNGHEDSGIDLSACIQLDTIKM